jgi:hypothetical protein
MSRAVLATTTSPIRGGVVPAARALCRPRHAAPDVLVLGGIRVPLPVLIVGTDYELPVTASPPSDYPYSPDTWESATLNLVAHVPELLGGALRCTAGQCMDLWPCGTASVAAGWLGIDVMGIAYEVLAMPTPGELARRAFAQEWAAQEARRREVLADWPPGADQPESSAAPAWLVRTTAESS